jgi:hypothetical protein
MKKLLSTVLFSSCLMAITPQCLSATLDADYALWNEVKSSNLIEEYQAYLTKYPNGNFAVLAKNRIKKLEMETSGVAKEKKQDVVNVADSSAMPKLPFDLSEDIWNTLKESDAYRNSPPPKAIKISQQVTTYNEPTGSKAKSLPIQTIVANTTIETTPISSKCTMQKNSTINDITSIKYPPYHGNSETVSYHCGLVTLGSTLQGGKYPTMTKRLDITGSLFPLKIGAEQSVSRATYSAMAPDLEMTFSDRCRVVRKGLAQEIDPSLTGVFWAISCESNFLSGGMKSVDAIKTSQTFEDYYLEDLGVFMRDIGVMDYEKHQPVLPSPGFKTVLTAEGDYGSRNTYTYQSHTWKIGK